LDEKLAVGARVFIASSASIGIVNNPIRSLCRRLHTGEILLPLQSERDSIQRCRSKAFGRHAVRMLWAHRIHSRVAIRRESGVHPEVSDERSLCQRHRRLLDEGCCLVRRESWAEEKTLRLAAIFRVKCLTLRLGFDTLGRCHRAQLLAQLDHSAHNGKGCGVSRNVLDE
jgi:hypothetical protein